MSGVHSCSAEGDRGTCSFAEGFSWKDSCLIGLGAPSVHEKIKKSDSNGVVNQTREKIDEIVSVFDCQLHA